MTRYNLSLHGLHSTIIESPDGECRNLQEAKRRLASYFSKKAQKYLKKLAWLSGASYADLLLDKSVQEPTKKEEHKCQVCGCGPECSCMLVPRGRRGACRKEALLEDIDGAPFPEEVQTAHRMALQDLRKKLEEAEQKSKDDWEYFKLKQRQKNDCINEMEKRALKAEDQSAGICEHINPESGVDVAVEALHDATNLAFWLGYTMEEKKKVIRLLANFSTCLANAVQLVRSQKLLIPIEDAQFFMSLLQEYEQAMWDARDYIRFSLDGKIEAIEP